MYLPNLVEGLFKKSKIKFFNAGPKGGRGGEIVAKC